MPDSRLNGCLGVGIGIDGGVRKDRARNYEKKNRKLVVVGGRILIVMMISAYT